MTDAAVSDPHSEEAHSSATRYVVIWLALLVLTGITYSVSRVDLGAWNLIVALAIAITKSTLVVLFFMHLSEHAGAMRLVFVMALVFVGLLILVTWSDVATRFPMTNPPTDQSSNGTRYRSFIDKDAIGPSPQTGTPP